MKKSILGHLAHAWGFLVELYDEFSYDNCFRLSAALSYYAVFSLAPVLIIVIALAGAFFGREAVSGEVFRQAQGVIGQEGASTLQTLVQSAYLDKGGSFTAWIAFGTLCLSASTLFSVIQDALNTIWKVRVKPSQGLLRFVFTRVLSFGMVLVVGFLLMISLVINTVLVALESYTEKVLSHYSAYALHAGQHVASLIIVSLLFALLFKYLPDVIIPWQKVWLPALLTGLLFGLGKGVIGLYLGHVHLNNTYGAAASILILLLWVNYSAWIFFFGAEYIFVSLRREGYVPATTRYATRLKISVEEEED